MKPPRLRAQLLANTAHHSKAEKIENFVSVLKRNKSGGSWSYGPLVSPLLLCLGVREPMAEFGAWPDLTLDELLTTAAGAAKQNEQKEAFEEIIRVAYPWANETVERATSYNVNAVKLGLLGPYKFWLDAIAQIDGQRVVLIPELRRQGELTRKGRRFVISLAHHSVLQSDAELSDGRVELLRFHKGTDSPRTLQLINATNVQGGLYSEGELSQLIADTADAWQIACRRVGRGFTKKDAEDLGPLFLRTGS